MTNTNSNTVSRGVYETTTVLSTLGREAYPLHQETKHIKSKREKQMLQNNDI